MMDMIFEERMFAILYVTGGISTIEEVTSNTYSSAPRQNTVQYD